MSDPHLEHHGSHPRRPPPGMAPTTRSFLAIVAVLSLPAGVVAKVAYDQWSEARADMRSVTTTSEQVLRGQIAIQQMLAQASHDREATRQEHERIERNEAAEFEQQRRQDQRLDQAESTLERLWKAVRRLERRVWEIGGKQGPAPNGADPPPPDMDAPP